jgi:hypothetical protein
MDNCNDDIAAKQVQKMHDFTQQLAWQVLAL